MAIFSSRTQSRTLSQRLSSPAMPDTVRGRWDSFWGGLSTRERRLVTIAGGSIMLACVYLLLWEPAATGRARLMQELPALRVQAAQMTTLAQEARSLAASVPPALSGATQRITLDKSLAQHGLKPSQLAVQGDMIHLQLDGVSFGAWTDWLTQVRDAQRLTVSEAHIAYVGAPALVNIRAVLRYPKGR